MGAWGLIWLNVEVGSQQCILYHILFITAIPALSQLEQHFVKYILQVVFHQIYAFSKKVVLPSSEKHLLSLSLSYTGLFKLLTLELEGNQLHDGNVPLTAFTPLRRLNYLRLDRNHFRTVPSGLPASLQVSKIPLI